MPNNYLHRVEMLEAAIAPQALKPLTFLVWWNQDIEALEAELCVAHNWPDDGLHPMVIYTLPKADIRPALQPDGCKGWSAKSVY